MYEVYYCEKPLTGAFIGTRAECIEHIRRLIARGWDPDEFDLLSHKTGRFVSFLNVSA